MHRIRKYRSGIVLAVWLLATGQPGLVPPAAAKIARASALGAGAVVLGGLVLVLGGRRLALATGWIAAGVLAIHAVDLTSNGRLLVAHRHPPGGPAQPLRHVERILPVEPLHCGVHEEDRERDAQRRAVGHEEEARPRLLTEQAVRARAAVAPRPEPGEEQHEAGDQQQPAQERQLCSRPAVFASRARGRRSIGCW